jgi:hypothetical protein
VVRDRSADLDRSCRKSGEVVQYVIEAKDRPAVQASQRRAVLEVVRVLLCQEAEPAQVRAVVGPKRLLSVSGHLEGDALWRALVRDHQLKDPSRWFLTEPVHVDGATWVVSNQWGEGTTRPWRGSRLCGQIC